VINLALGKFYGFESLSVLPSSDSNEIVSQFERDENSSTITYPSVENFDSLL